MSFAEQSFFEQRYQKLDDEELSVLFARSLSNPELLTKEAQLALIQVISQRNINVSAELGRRKIAQNQDQIMANAKLTKSQYRSKKVSAGVGKAIGWIGLAGAVVVLTLSIQQIDIGGIFAGLVTLVFSVWLAFWYTGD